MSSESDDRVVLKIDEVNDLTFKIRLEGDVSSPAKVRLVCENSEQDVSYMFKGYGTGEDEVVQFTIPRMDGRLSEGAYRARVEVIVENKHFVPLTFDVDFKRSVSVVAEAIQVKPRQRNDLKVTAEAVTRSAPIQPTIKFEQRPVEPAREAKVQHAAVEKKHVSLKEKFGRK